MSASSTLLDGFVSSGAAASFLEGPGFIVRKADIREGWRLRKNLGDVEYFRSTAFGPVMAQRSPPIQCGTRSGRP